LWAKIVKVLEKLAKSSQLEKVGKIDKS
jgi:hypothetical protein